MIANQTEQLRALVQSFVGRGVSLPPVKERSGRGRPRTRTDEEQLERNRLNSQRLRKANLVKGLRADGKPRARLGFLAEYISQSGLTRRQFEYRYHKVRSAGLSAKEAAECVARGGGLGGWL